MKRVIFALMLIVVAIAQLNTAVSAAEQPISVILDDMELTFNAQPRIVHDRTLVPLRGIFEAMGATVLWNGESQTITALRLDSVVKLTIGNSDALVDKEKQPLDVPAQIFEDSTFVPLRFISESMGAEVSWDSATQTVTITTDKAHWSDPGDNLSLNLLFTHVWVNVDTNEKMTFDPEMFLEINDEWPDASEDLFYSYSETNEAERNIISMYLGSAHLKDHYLEFDPEARILTEYLSDEILSNWCIDEDAEAVAAKIEEEEEPEKEFAYVDEEYGFILIYPSVFAPEPVDADDVMMRFPSLIDDTLLQYWVIPNTYEDTLDSFVEAAQVEEIQAYHNVAIGWNNDLDQVTGEITPTAYFWVVEQDWIVCVAISCETEEQAVEWCEKMVDETAILIDRFY